MVAFGHHMEAAMKKWRERVSNGFTVQHIGVILLGLALISGIAGYTSQHPGPFDLNKLFADFYANITSELVGIAITVLIIDSLNRRREEIVETRREREQLTRQLGSTVNEVAK